MARPAEFERDDVLEKAMQAFWIQGYHATSMADLSAATELGPGSIYAAFQSKEGLFLAALDHYGARSVANIEQALSKSESPLEAIRDYFGNLVKEAVKPQAQRSCFLVNTVLELARGNAGVQRRVNCHLARIETLFRNALEGAQARGELAPGKDPASLAAFLMTSIWGLRVLAGTGPQSARTQAVVGQILILLS
ncbi:MAG TPA: TetR/AcrR family transcriptional regulator [Rhodocyclaceae bacterium]|nr:TetR/AcrR family transcriptional regulator [Rhodocyclaceae bacterium]